ncbi:hypothetical protein ZIOFF_033255 [Zingiber officinale]|uniref:Protein kinase domain-containing protein n=1 Tax=Zingiber officinale TaxID=94328 RepID=A0A8J5GJ70_ZINOF|nr:hypothetical protein ZIOFF_033255 [Zingiber officinale]
MIVWFLLSYKLWNRGVAVDLIEKFLRRQQTLMPTRYAYSELIAITRHFREKLGQGGFGSVFKGELLGDRFVAVKMLSKKLIQIAVSAVSAKMKITDGSS